MVVGLRFEFSGIAAGNFADGCTPILSGDYPYEAEKEGPGHSQLVTALAAGEQVRCTYTNTAGQQVSFEVKAIQKPGTLTLTGLRFGPPARRWYPRRDFDRDINSDEAAAVDDALSLVFQILPTLGAEGEQLKSELLKVKQILENEEGLLTGRTEAFRGFHYGLTLKESREISDDTIQEVWASNQALNSAFIVGQKAARLNYLFKSTKQARSGRPDSQFLDGDDTRGIFAHAMAAFRTIAKRRAANR